MSGKHDAEIRVMFLAGRKYREIADGLGIPKNTVASTCRRLGLRRGDRHMAEVVRQRKAIRAPSEGDTACAKLRRLPTATMTIPELAAAVGVSEWYVRQQCRRLGLEYRRRPRGGQRVDDRERRSDGTLPPDRVFQMSTGSKPILRDMDTRGCRYPVGDPKVDGFHFCCARTAAGRPYCAEHAALCYVPHSSPAERRIVRAIEFVAGKGAPR